MSDPASWKRLFIREAILGDIRSFFNKRQFHEIDTPVLISHPPAESCVDVFQTVLRDRNNKEKLLYLATSPEVALKKLMVAGLGDCFALTKSFRNTETQSKTHHPEFTILEWYRIGADYKHIMEDSEDLIASLCVRIFGRETKTITYQGITVDIEKPWERISIREAFSRYAYVNFDEFIDPDIARGMVLSKGYKVEPTTTWEQMYNQIFLNEVEPHLGKTKATILYDFPSSMAALAKVKSSDHRFAERFEFYIAGLELGDCYSELTDWAEQERRFIEETSEIRRLGKTAYDYDHDFIEALKAGLPECSGIAVGVDRLVMLLTDSADIHDILYFPID